MVESCGKFNIFGVCSPEEDTYKAAAIIFIFMASATLWSGLIELGDWQTLNYALIGWISVLASAALVFETKKRKANEVKDYVFVDTNQVPLYKL